MTTSTIDARGFYHPDGAPGPSSVNVAALTIPELFALAEGARVRSSVEEAIAVYEAWLALNPENPQAFAAYFNLGAALSNAGRMLAAIRAYRDALRAKPDFSQARLNLGRALEESGRGSEAYQEWRAGIDRLAPVTGDAITQKVLLLLQSARLLEHHAEDATAEKMLEHLVEIDPNHVEAMRQLVGIRNRLCRWPAITASSRVRVRDKMATLWPLTVANLYDDPMFQLARACGHVRAEFAPPDAETRSAIRNARAAVAARRKPRLRIGYVSSDLREHPVGLAMTQLFEKHDRSKFEVFAYYCGIDRDDSVRRRIVAASEHWVDITAMSDEEAALTVARDGVDIVVDLNGYTKFARTRMFAMRPAPVVVNWFGFPATMGSPFHNYIIADSGVIPEGDEIFYSEEVLRLPCYQPNDRLREVAKTRPTRSDMGLPEDAFVYCSFNGVQKLTQRMYDSWLAILSATPGSVLWLLKATDDANARLKSYAAQHGVAAERIIFADKLGNPEHLARYPLADLFLDSFPYGAHTTASDALWMGVPVLALQGRAFAARVCGSLLAAAGVPELIASSEAEYRTKAIVLYHHRGLVAEFKQRLLAGREKSTLFDVDRLVRGLEGLYAEMARREAQGRTPQPDLTNLDVYHEIALGLDMESVNTMSREAYLAAYAEALAARHAYDPIPHDGRLWRAEPAGAARRAAG